tara:strand:+ start:893 stop:1009 length:117 start_codon:yes stop_codon:yes gene_type:complete
MVAIKQKQKQKKMKKIIAKLKHEWNSFLYYLMFKKKNK